MINIGQLIPKLDIFNFAKNVFQFLNQLELMLHEHSIQMNKLQNSSVSK